MDKTKVLEQVTGFGDLITANLWKNTISKKRGTKVSLKRMNSMIMEATLSGEIQQL